MMTHPLFDPALPHLDDLSMMSHPCLIQPSCPPSPEWSVYYAPPLCDPAPFSPEWSVYDAPPLCDPAPFSPEWSVYDAGRC